VQDFAELGEFFNMPVRSYSSGMKARLTFGMSMGIHFDWYLVDEITAVGDTAFKRKSLSVFKHRLQDAGLVRRAPRRSAHRKKRPRRPLPGRRNIVVTRNQLWAATGAERAGSLGDALDLVEGTPRVFVIGGGELYAEALPLADELLLTEIDVEVDGDTFFPPFDRDVFAETSRESHVTEDGTPFAFVTYARPAPGQPSP